MAELLTQHFPSVDSLMNATECELIAIQGVGPKIASSIVSYFLAEGNRRIIRRMRDAGVIFEANSEISGYEESPLEGVSFCITGVLMSMTRLDAEARIQTVGGRSTSNVTRGTNYLIVGDKPGAKIDDARRLNVEILCEEQFLQMLNDAERSIL